LSGCREVEAAKSAWPSERAFVLACLRGKHNDEVAREIGVRPNTVGQWRRRFAERGIAGLRDEPGPGKPAKYGIELRDRILGAARIPTAARHGELARWRPH